MARQSTPQHTFRIRLQHVHGDTTTRTVIAPTVQDAVNIATEDCGAGWSYISVAVKCACCDRFTHHASWKCHTHRAQVAK